jgi:endonuclease/exonuclease/phosphatase family metal-dependent hydrolase
VTTIRIMTYSVQRCRGVDGRVDPDRTRRVIEEAAPDIVAIQQIDSSAEHNQLQSLAERLGMRCYANARENANALLSYYPLKGIHEYSLGGEGCCQRADADIGGKRLHIFNIRLDSAYSQRRRQIETLLGPELVGNRLLICPMLVLGDFADMLWGAGNLGLSMMLRRAGRPLWGATFPSRFPLIGRDRAYLRGELRIVDAKVQRTILARQASSHLPLVLTVQVADPRNYLRVDRLNDNRMEIATG